MTDYYCTQVAAYPWYPTGDNGKTMVWGTTVFFSGLNDNKHAWEHKYYRQNPKGQMVASASNAGDKSNIQIWVQKRTFIWHNVGTLKDFDATVKKYPHFMYEYATNYNMYGSSVSPIVLSSYQGNYRLTQQPLYPTGDEGIDLSFGTAVFTRELKMIKGKLSRSAVWQQFYYVENANGQMSFLAGNGASNNVNFYVKRRLNSWSYAGKISDFSMIVKKYPFTQYDYGMKYNEIAGSIHNVIVNSWNKGIRVRGWVLARLHGWRLCLIYFSRYNHL